MKKKSVCVVAISLAILIILVVMLIIGQAESKNPPLLISALVMDKTTGTPIQGARVSDHMYGPEPFKGAVTNDSGECEYFTWTERHSVIAKATGYKPQVLIISTGSNQSKTRVSLRFDLSPVGGEEVNVNAKVKQALEKTPSTSTNNSIDDSRMLDDLADSAVEDRIGSRRPFYERDTTNRNKQFPEIQKAVTKAATDMYNLMIPNNLKEMYDKMSDENKRDKTFEQFKEEKLKEAYGYIYRRSRIFAISYGEFKQQVKDVRGVRVLEVTVQGPEFAMVRMKMHRGSPELPLEKTVENEFWLRWFFDEGKWCWVIPGMDKHKEHEARGRREQKLDSQYYEPNGPDQ
ncbi:MAG: carboxypeptidase-like regulatory domain-containing protein [Planctomycetota bacterium]